MKFNFALWFIADELVTCAIQTAIQLPVIKNILYFDENRRPFWILAAIMEKKSFYQKHNRALCFWVNESVWFAMITDIKLQINTE